MSQSLSEFEVLHTEIHRQENEIITFLRNICAIPSAMGKIKAVADCVGEKMLSLGYDEVRFDLMGNILGRIGNGPKILLYDSHLDTVDVGDPAAWGWDPFQGKVENGILFARGACDEKGSTPGMVYGLALARRLGFLDGFTAYYYGNMEEDCDGIAPNALVEIEGIRPHFVVIGEPTKMQVYRGHKGRVELRVVAKGRSIHAASNWLGDNAVYKMLPVIAGIKALDGRLAVDPFLGKGTITVSMIDCRTPSINAVPDECTLHIDRRITFGETKELAVQQVCELIPSDQREHIRVEVLHYDTPSYTGMVFPVEKYFPGWALPEEHPFVHAACTAYEQLWKRQPQIGKWNFSTNGIYWMGKAGIPSIGFGPGDEETAHSVLDQVPLAEVVGATHFYAALPHFLQRNPM
jgi:putative selenium metabolism hydrolase